MAATARRACQLTDGVAAEGQGGKLKRQTAANSDKAATIKAMRSEGGYAMPDAQESAMLARIIDALQDVTAAHAEELNALDEALGDGDHGVNLARAMVAIKARRSALAQSLLDEALSAMAAIVAEDLGPRAGPLWAALLQGMAEAAPRRRRVTLADLSQMVDSGIAGVKATGRAEPGDKTLLDVLCPVGDVLREAVEGAPSADLDQRLVAAAGHGLSRTRGLEARRGLAATAKGHGLEHLDPGACSAALCVGAIVGVLAPAAA